MIFPNQGIEVASEGNKEAQETHLLSVTSDERLTLPRSSGSFCALVSQSVGIYDRPRLYRPRL